MKSNPVRIHPQTSQNSASSLSGLVLKLLLAVCFFVILACGGNGGTFGKLGLEVTSTPEALVLRAGETKSVSVKFSLGDLSNGIFPIRTSADGLTVSPTAFDVNLNTVREITQVIQVTAPAGAASGSYKLLIGDAFSVYQEVPITVSDGDPDFTILATPSVVTPSSDVQFTVSSVNGYSGTVKITWVVDGGASPSPDTNNFTGTVSPTSPFTFTRKMYRYSTSSEDIPIVFNVTDVPFTKQRSTTITVKASP